MTTDKFIIPDIYGHHDWTVFQKEKMPYEVILASTKAKKDVILWCYNQFGPRHDPRVISSHKRPNSKWACLKGYVFGDSKPIEEPYGHLSSNGSILVRNVHGKCAYVPATHFHKTKFLFANEKDALLFRLRWA